MKAVRRRVPNVERIEVFEEEVDDEDEELETPEAALQRHLAEDSCSRSVAPLCKRKKII